MPATTVTEAPEVEPLIVPLPVIDQEWMIVPPAGVTVDVCVLVEPGHTLVGPSTEQSLGTTLQVVGITEVIVNSHPPLMVPTSPVTSSTT